MSLHIDTLPAVRRIALATRRDATPAALAAWLESHDLPDLHSRAEGGVTPLMLASLHGNDAIVHALLAQGARLDALDDCGNHALWYACESGAPAPVLRLIDAGIDIDHANDDDITCLMQAAASGRVEMMQLLLSCGACESPCTPDGRNALDMAADRGLQLLRAARRLQAAGTRADDASHEEAA